MMTKTFFIDTDEQGRIKNPPQLPPNQHIEVNVRISEHEKESDDAKTLRKPSLKIAGKAQIKGNVFSSEEDWNLP